MPPTVDLLQRPLHDLRISVTDRCNLRCPYCMPREVFGAGFRFIDRAELLSFEEIVRVARAGVEHGVRKVRLTGGEPLLRRDLASLVELLARVPGIEDIALTTNGTALAAHAQTLADAGLDRVTVSLDALEQEVFRSMSDTRLPIARVLAGIDAAHDAGLSPVKINMVVRRGVNDHCVLEMAEHFRGRPETLRFIEYMDVGESNGWELAEVVPARELLAAIESRWPLQRLTPKRAGEVATRWAYRDGAGEIGVIHSVSQPFCGSCSRARLSADGTLFTCLFAERGTDLRAPLRAGADDAQLTQLLGEVWRGRGDRYSELRALREGRQQPRPRQRAHDPAAKARRGRAKRIEMSYIGG